MQWRVSATKYFKHYGLGMAGRRLRLFLMSVTIEESDHETAQEKTTTMLNNGSEPRSTGEAKQDNSLEHFGNAILVYATKTQL